MAFEPIPYDLDVEGLGRDEVSEAFGPSSFALALRSGRLVATVVSKKSGKHITVQLRAKRREGKRFRACELAEAERIYFDAPGIKGSAAAEIGCLHLTGKWAGKILPPWQREFDQPRIWAARRILDVAHGRAPVSDEQAKILEGKICLMCARELTDPESIARNIGPDCWARATGAVAATGEHEPPGDPLDLAEGSAEDGAMGYDVPDGASADEALAALNSQGFGEELRELGDQVRGEASREEVREQIEVELQETVKQPAGEDVDPLPAAPSAVSEGLFLLRAGDDPRRVLEEAQA